MKNICVYCGSRQGQNPAFVAAARHLATVLVERGLGLVYGGADRGIMGVLADAMLAAGGDVTGIMPQSLVDKEQPHGKLTTLHITDNMHERKALMADMADGFIALPGGLGTLEEILEILTWAQLGFHTKPCGLLNVAGYYDHLQAFLESAVTEGFVAERHKNMLMIESDASTLLAKFEDYQPPPAKGH